jgi:flagellar protein FliO/FliZ
MRRLALPPLVLLCVCDSAYAAEQASTSSAGSLLQVLMGLVVVLGLLAGTAWIIRRLGLAQPSSVSAVKVIGGTSVGTRERIVLVEVADQWIVVGIAPGCINALSTMPRQEGFSATEATPVTKNFSAWLKQTIEKRNGQ